VWLPLLRDEIMRSDGNIVALVSSVATRWTMTWLSAISVLQFREAFDSVLTSQAVRERLYAAEVATSQKFTALRTVAAISKTETSGMTGISCRLAFAYH
jgi:hypothetical protein